MPENFIANGYALPLSDIVFNTIRDSIITGELKPGERLLEKRLAEKIGVSRTPVREALRKLELEGFILVTPRKGAVVTVMNERDIKDVLVIRAALEGLAASLACENMAGQEIDKIIAIKEEFEEAAEKQDLEAMLEKDIELHDLIFKASKNFRLAIMINNLREQIYRFRMAYLKDSNYIDSIIKEHGELIKAIVEKNKSLAEALSVAHIQNQAEAIIKSIK
jgi:DNA-binding GntR family transcriptional regulator